MQNGGITMKEKFFIFLKYRAKIGKDQRL